jgi:hypothetical protein
MIITGKRETYDGTWRIVNYATEAEGRLAPRLETTFADADIPLYYAEQELRFEALRRQLEAGEISPIGFYLELLRLTVEDVAARVDLRRSEVRAHLVPEGFARARVRELESYAQVFDVDVADFFQIAVLRGGVRVEERTRRRGRLLQTVVLAPAGPGDAPADEPGSKAR